MGRADIAGAGTAEPQELERLPVGTDLPGLDLAAVAVIGHPDRAVEFGAIGERQVTGERQCQLDEPFLHVQALLVSDDAAARTGEEIVRGRNWIVER